MLSVTSEQVEIDIKEVYRYLGYGSAEPEGHIAETIRDCVREVEAVSELRSFCRDFPLSGKGNAGADGSSEANADMVTIGSVHIESAALARHLDSCVKVYVFGATIGIGLDRLIARASISDMTKATIYQAVGAAYIEAYCDVINDELDGIARAEGKGTRIRFSPGYGDFDIEYQADLFKLLDLTKHTGISLTEGMLMTPSKSVTAIVGVTCEGATCVGVTCGGADDDEQYEDSQEPDPAEKKESPRHNCEHCDLVDCRFRRSSG